MEGDRPDTPDRQPVVDDDDDDDRRRRRRRHLVGT